MNSDSPEVLLGQTISLRAQALDPDGDPILYIWSSTGGSIGNITGNGTKASWTAPLQGGTFGVTLTVTDGLGGSDTRTLTLQVVPARYLFSIPVPGRPARVAVDTQGTIYVTVPGRGEVRIYDESGNYLRTIQELWRPLGIAVDNGRIYVGDEGFHEVRVFDAAGAYVRSLGSGRGEVTKPSDVAVDPLSGRVYVSDGAEGIIKVYSSSPGDLQFSFGRSAEGDPWLQYPGGLTIDGKTGKLLVADFDASSIKAYDVTNGSFSWVLGPYSAPVYLAQGCFPPPCVPQLSTADSVPARLEGVAVDRNGWLYAAETGLSVIDVFDTNGNFVAILGGEGTGPGQLRTPTDAAIDSQDRLIVADAGNNRLQVYGLAEYVARNPAVNPPPPGSYPPPVVPLPSGTGTQTNGGSVGRGIGCSCSIGRSGGSDAFINLLPWAVLFIAAALLRRRKSQ